jgi:Ca2+-binding EF-hand superfamily protein
MLKGTPVERLKLLFDILDSDSDGYITYSEVFPRGGRSVQPSMDTCLPACMREVWV